MLLIRYFNADNREVVTMFGPNIETRKLIGIDKLLPGGAKRTRR